MVCRQNVSPNNSEAAEMTEQNVSEFNLGSNVTEFNLGSKMQLLVLLQQLPLSFHYQNSSVFHINLFYIARCPTNLGLD